MKAIILSDFLESHSDSERHPLIWADSTKCYSGKMKRMRLCSQPLVCHCLLLGGIKAGVQWEDEHHFMDSSVSQPARNCGIAVVHDMLMRSDICKIDEGGKLENIQSDKQLNSWACSVRGLIWRKVAGKRRSCSPDGMRCGVGRNGDRRSQTPEDNITSSTLG